MKTIKARIDSTYDYVCYEINGKIYEAWGEFYFNKKLKRFEHTHIGPRGGETLIVWKVK